MVSTTLDDVSELLQYESVPIRQEREGGNMGKSLVQHGSIYFR